MVKKNGSDVDAERATMQIPATTTGQTKHSHKWIANCLMMDGKMASRKCMGFEKCI